MQGITITLLASVLLIGTVRAAALPGALGLFYSYSQFCGDTPPTPPAGTLHLCMNSSDGPMTKELDHQGTSAVFANPKNPRQFVIVLFDSDSDAHVQTAHHDIHVIPSNDKDGCVDFDMEDAKGQMVNVGTNCPQDGQAGFP